MEYILMNKCFPHVIVWQRDRRGCLATEEVHGYPAREKEIKELLRMRTETGVLAVGKVIHGHLARRKNKLCRKFYCYVGLEYTIFLELIFIDVDGSYISSWIKSSFEFQILIISKEIQYHLLQFPLPPQRFLYLLYCETLVSVTLSCSNLSWSETKAPPPLFPSPLSNILCLAS